MKHIIRIIIGAICLYSSFISSDSQLPNTINGVHITPHTLFDLMTKMPPVLRKKIDCWLNNAQIKQMINQLVDFPDIEMWQAKYQADQQLMKQLGYDNLSRSNYIAHIPGTGYVFKITGPENRLFSMLATKGLVDDRLWTDEAFFTDQVNMVLQNEPLPTYQTASHAAYYLLLNNLMQKKRFQFIRVPRTYLLYIPGHEQVITDDHTMIVQAYDPDAEKLIERPELIRRLPNEAIDELYEAVVSTGISRIKDSVFVDKKGVVHLIHGFDLEQPANTSAKDFFHRSKERFDANVHDGLKELLELCAADEQKVARIKDSIRKDSRLKSSIYYQDIEQLAQ